MDYSVHDAILAGFNKIIFVIRKEIEEGTYHFDDIVRIMEKCDVCRIALNNNGYPYILPLNFGMKVENNVCSGILNL